MARLRAALFKQREGVSGGSRRDVEELNVRGGHELAMAVCSWMHVVDARGHTHRPELAHLVLHQRHQEADNGQALEQAPGSRGTSPPSRTTSASWRCRTRTITSA